MFPERLTSELKKHFFLNAILMEEPVYDIYTIEILDEYGLWTRFGNLEAPISCRGI